MKGRLEKVTSDWMVFFVVERNNMKFERGLKVNPSQIPHLQTTISIMVENNGKQVDFEIIDEFTNPEYYKKVGWGDGESYAHLLNIPIDSFGINNKAYSEGLINPYPPREIYQFIKRIFKKFLYL